MMAEILTFVVHCLLKPAEKVCMRDGHIWKTWKTWSKKQFISRACKMSGAWEYSLPLIFASSVPAYEYWILWLVDEWFINTGTHAEQNRENVCFHEFCLTTVLLETEQNSGCMGGLPMRCSCCKSHGKFNFEWCFTFHEWLVVTFVLWWADHVRRLVSSSRTLILFSSSESFCSVPLHRVTFWSSIFFAALLYHIPVLIILLIIWRKR